ALSDAIFVLITSNHGANANGEEYNRRNHFVYFDGAEVLTYKPGRTSCEPFRKYNTQGNGIYGGSVKSDAAWQSFSNWCPGDVISTRIISLGALTAGDHSFRLEVPDAVFAAGQGYFPISLYLQGKTSGTILSIDGLQSDAVHATVYPNPSGGMFTIETEEKISRVSVSNLLGQEVFSGKEKSINLSQLPAGMYWAKITLAGDKTITRKLIKK
ncbi:MAG: T9SS type A sorting domain-containing protein, partial [Sphingobacteriales bacterium]